MQELRIKIPKTKLSFSVFGILKYLFRKPESEIIINDSSVSFGKSYMMNSEIDSVAYGSHVVTVNLLARFAHYRICLKDRQGQKILIKFHNIGLSFLYTKKKEETFQQLVMGLWHFILNKRMQEMLRDLNRGTPVTLGPCTLDLYGLDLEYRGVLLRKKRERIEWNDLQHSVNNGLLLVTSLADSKVRSLISLMRTDNAVLLNAMLDHIKSQMAKKHFTPGGKIPEFT